MQQAFAFAWVYACNWTQVEAPLMIAGLIAVLFCNSSITHESQVSTPTQSVAISMYKGSRRCSLCAHLHLREVFLSKVLKWLSLDEHGATWVGHWHGLPCPLSTACQIIASVELPDP